MIIEHMGQAPEIHPDAYIAPNATICGNVIIEKGCRIMHGVQIIAESNPIVIGENCIVLENAVLRAAAASPLKIGNHCLIGPNAHLASCTIEDEVFIATGASIFHGSTVQKGAEIRINAIVHLKTIFPEGETLPIGWIAVGNPMKMFPPKDHEELWKIQKELNFQELVYQINKNENQESENKILCQTMSNRLSVHKNDKVLHEF